MGFQVPDPFVVAQVDRTHRLLLRAQWLHQDVKGLGNSVIGGSHVVDEATRVNLNLRVKAVHGLLGKDRGYLSKVIENGIKIKIVFLEGLIIN